MGKWIGVTRVRNECDIIEMFVRQNLSVLDELHIVVNNNTDSTAEILSELKKEGLPLFPYNDTFLDNRQEIVITNLLRTAIDPSECEWCFLLDADEFIDTSREELQAELKQVPAKSFAAWEWKTYIPLEDLDDNDISLNHGTNAFRSINFRRDPEPAFNPKIIIPNDLFHSIAIAPGSHGAWDENGNVVPVHMLSSRLIHIPFRSSEQVISKLSLGELSLRMKINRGATEGSHWSRGYLSIKAGEKPSVTKCALLFSSGTKNINDIKLVYDPINWAPSALIKYEEKRNVSAFLNVLNFAELVSLRLNEMTGKILKNEIATDILATKACKHGLIAYYKDDLVVGRSLELYGEWAERELDCLGEYIRNGDTIIDVGANIGAHSVYFSKKVGKDGVVHAFEPQRRAFHLLNMNAALNACENLITYQEAVCNSIGTVAGDKVGGDRSESIGKTSLPHNGGDVIQTRTIDDLQLEKLKLIKIAVKGMGCDVILGAANTINRCHPILFLNNEIEERSHSLLEALLRFNYRLYWHFSSYFNDANFFGNALNCFQNARQLEINIVALPATISVSPSNLEPVISISEAWEDAYSRACQNGRC